MYGKEVVLMRKPYEALEADILMMLANDVITTSDGGEHGMGGGVAPDEDWQVGKGGINFL